MLQLMLHPSFGGNAVKTIATTITAVAAPPLWAAVTGTSVTAAAGSAATAVGVAAVAAAPIVVPAVLGAGLGAGAVLGAAKLWEWLDNDG